MHPSRVLGSTSQPKFQPLPQVQSREAARQWLPKVVKAAADWSSNEAQATRTDHEYANSSNWDSVCRNFGSDYRNQAASDHSSPPEPTAVPPGKQFFHGNLDVALPYFVAALEERGLTATLQDLRPPADEISSSTVEDSSAEEAWAADLLLMHCQSSLLTVLPLKYPVTVRGLLPLIQERSGAFRFLDLPRELRDSVYEYLMPVRQIYNELALSKYEGEGDNRKRFTKAIIREPQVASLCAVSQTLRAEVSKAHYSCNYFSFDEEDLYACGMLGFSHVLRWAKTVGVHNLRHVRSLEITFQTGAVDHWDTFAVAFNQKGGLKLEVTKVFHSKRQDVTERLEEHRALIEKRKKDEEWDSTGVVEFFLLDPDALRRAMYGAPDIREDESEVVDERDAYQVAYGRRLVVDWSKVCPW